MTSPSLAREAVRLRIVTHDGMIANVGSLAKEAVTAAPQPKRTLLQRLARWFGWYAVPIVTQRDAP